MAKPFIVQKSVFDLRFSESRGVRKAKMTVKVFEGISSRHAW